MILATVEDLKQYISIADSYQFEEFTPYITKAVNTFTKKYVGNLHIELATDQTGTNAEVKNEAREHLRNAIANFGWFINLPTASVIMDSSGISVAQNEHRKSADFWQIKDIRREALRAGHEAMDFLLEVLEASPDVFTDYATNYSSINNELIVNNAMLFSKYHNINNSRQTYLALQPTMRMVEDQYLKTLICNELLQELKKPTSTALLNQLKEPLQKAMVLLTVSKVATIGMFELSSLGLRLNFETYLGGRKQAIDYGKPTEEAKALATQLTDTATIYLQEAKQIIINNLTSFTQCQSPLIGYNEEKTAYKTYNTKGILAI